MNSWGRIYVVTHDPSVVQDDLGYLWVDGDTAPTYQLPPEHLANPGAIVMWTDVGIGLWVHPRSLRALPSISRRDMASDKWLPVNVVAVTLPTFISEPA